MFLTVVIPTRDRWSVLERTLSALERQQSAPRFEVVVVDDGSAGGPGGDLRERHPGLDLRLVRRPAHGPSAARNAGVAVAGGDRIVFLGDDTVPAPGCLAAHARGPSGVGVQGFVDWDPAVGITDLMRFLAPAGPQFWFVGLTPEAAVPPRSVLGSNLSAPAAWVREEPFDETFSAAAMEDTEMALRWRRRGWRVVYRPEALCFHHHRYDRLEDFLARQERAGRSARHLVRRHPGQLWPVVVLPGLVGLWRRLVPEGVPSRRSRRHVEWDRRCRSAFLRGFVLGVRRPPA